MEGDSKRGIRGSGPGDGSLAPIRFLGLCRRAMQRGFSWDVMGLSQLVSFPYLPQKLSGLGCVIAVDKQAFGASGDLAYKVILTDISDPRNSSWSEQRLSFGSGVAETSHETDSHSFVVPRNGSQKVSAELLAPFESLEGPGSVVVAYPAPPLIVWRPTRVRVEVQVGEEVWEIGEIVCGYRRPPPLTAEERRALASRPHATKAVRYEMKCTLCGASICISCRLDPNEEFPDSEIPVNIAPDTWQCECDPPRSIDLRFMKEGLHDVLRRETASVAEEESLGFVPLYEAGRVGLLVTEYEELIRGRPREEDVQKFLERNPVFWTFLAPTRILHKPPVLTKKAADFAIVTSAKTLFFIEIEKPTTKLINKNGGISAEIMKGANQIRDWQSTILKHRGALLDELGFGEAGIQHIRYVLIGGLAYETPVSGLSKLRHDVAPLTDFYCFDELGSFVRRTSAALADL